MAHVRAAHISLQFSDSAKQQERDIVSLFHRATQRNYAWLTGTESAPGSGNKNGPLLDRIGEDSGFRMWVPSLYEDGEGRFADCWIAVRENFVNGPWKTDYRHVIPRSAKLYAELNHENPAKMKPKWGPKGLTTVEFKNNRLGEFNLGSAHYLRYGDEDTPDAVIHGVDHYEWNKKLAKEIEDWALEVGKGPALAFYAGDQNMNDRKYDTFHGGPMTSVADELRRWQNTGHGPIDVMASFNRDKRVEAMSFRVFDDTEFFLHTDHFLLEAIYRIEPLAA